jgi:hypothetical protein
MQLSSNRAVGGIGLLLTIIGGWLFVAGFEQPWTAGHFGTLALLVLGLLLCFVGYAKALFGGKK